MQPNSTKICYRHDGSLGGLIQHILDLDEQNRYAVIYGKDIKPVSVAFGKSMRVFE